MEAGGGTLFIDEDILLIGIVHGTKGDNTGGKIGLITPTFYLNDLFSD